MTNHLHRNKSHLNQITTCTRINHVYIKGTQESRRWGHALVIWFFFICVDGSIHGKLMSFTCDFLSALRSPYSLAHTVLLVHPCYQLTLSSVFFLAQSIGFPSATSSTVLLVRPQMCVFLTRMFRRAGKFYSRNHVW